MKPRQALLLAVAALVVQSSLLEAQDQRNIERRIRESQDRLNRIRQERSGLERELDQLRERVHNLAGELQNLERQKGATSRLVNELDRQIGALSTSIDTVTGDLILAQDEEAETRAVLERRLTDIYKRGQLWVFEVLLAAESFGDLLNRYKYLYLVSRQDRTLVSEVEALRNQISTQRSQLVRLREELGRNRSERGLELNRYNRIEQERERRLARIAQVEQETAQRIASLDRDEDRINETINELIAARSRLAASAAGGAISSADLGALAWPVDGPLAYRFGQYPGPNNTVLRRDGIGIRTPAGTAVRAVAAGQVIYAKQLGTYGLTVVIEHGGDFYTLYHHLSSIDVANGTRVGARQVIGRSGGENSDVGSHLGFQIRQGQLRLDPLNWLQPRN